VFRPFPQRRSGRTGFRMRVALPLLTLSLGQIASTIYVPSLPAIAAGLASRSPSLAICWLSRSACWLSGRCPIDAGADE
jgi:hypothetical protein